MEKIGTIGKIKITNEGMIANVKLDNTYRNKVLIEIYKLEDRILILEFKYAGLEQLKIGLDDEKSAWLKKTFTMAQKKIQKEINSIKRTLKNISKLL
jgi:hypothetical protein